jgi:hypothetical protein
MNKKIATEIIWRRGEKNEQSLKINKQQLTSTIETNSETNTNNMNNTNNNLSISETQNPSLMNGMHSIGTQGPCLLGNEIVRNNSKRGLYNDKLNERQMFNQVGQNPFMIKNNYVNDLVNQNKFLIPKNSNSDNDY